MDYTVTKTIEHRLEEATRSQKRAELVREARALRQDGRPGILRLAAERFTSWTRRGIEVACDIRAPSRREPCADD